jgi:anaerobic selenocysteine-containing dehydrogenase
MIVSVDYRINTTGLYSDYILPAAQHYEKLAQSMPSVHHLNWVLCDRAVEPQGDSLSDTDIGMRLVEKIEQRPAQRGIAEFQDRTGQTRSLEGLTARATMNGLLTDDESVYQEGVRDSAVYGLLPEGTTMETLREKGFVRFTGWGMVGHGYAQASTIRPDEVHNPSAGTRRTRCPTRPSPGARSTTSTTSGFSRPAKHSPSTRRPPGTADRSAASR